MEKEGVSQGKKKLKNFPTFNFSKLKPKGGKLFFAKLLLVALPIFSLIYLLPDIVIPVQDRKLFFNNYSGLSGNNNLDVQLPGITRTYAYTIQSLNDISDEAEWDRSVADDRIQLEKRVQSFLGSNNYEIRQDRRNEKVVFTVFSTENIGAQASVFTASNSDFKISTVDTTAAQSTEQTEAPATKELNLKRNNFRDAEIKVESNPNASQGGGQFVYQVRLPLGLIGAEQLNIINENTFSTITVSIGGKDYNASFLPNVSNVITHLVINGIENPDEATGVQTFLNTDPYRLGYEVIETRVNTNDNGLYKLLSLIGLFLVSVMIFRKLLTGNFEWKKLLIIISIIITALAAAKLFFLTITTGFVVVLMTIVLLSLFNAPFIYYAGLLGILALTKLLGYLYYMQFTPRDFLLIGLVSLLIFATNYVYTNKFEKKIV